ncbi:hypothetical protein [Streptomyces sp. NPDC096012]
MQTTWACRPSGTTPSNGCQLGTSPQAFGRIGLVGTALTLFGADEAG